MACLFLGNLHTEIIMKNEHPNNLRKIRIGVPTRDGKKLTLEKVSSGIGSQLRTYQRWETGQIPVPSPMIGKVIEYYRINHALHLTAADILPNHNDIKAGFQREAVFRDVNHGPETVPIIGKIDSQRGAVDISKREEIGRSPIHPSQRGFHNAVDIPVPDSSMAPRHEMGESTHVVMDMQPKAGQDCWVELLDGWAYLRRFVGIEKDRMIFRQFNPDEKWARKTSEIKALHAVVR